MKVITEERLREKFEESQHKYLKAPLERIYEPNAVMNTLHELIDECQELDTLTVTRLRPMSEIQEGDILVKWIRENGLRGAFYVDGWVYVNGSNYKPEEFQGWIPIPKYEPEK